MYRVHDMGYMYLYRFRVPVPISLLCKHFLKWRRRLSWQNFDRRQRLSPTNCRENVPLSPLPPLPSFRNEASPAWRSNQAPGFIMDRNRTGSCRKNRSRRAKMRRRQLESWWTTIHKDFIGNKEIFSSLVKYTIFMFLHPLFILLVKVGL